MKASRVGLSVLVAVLTCADGQALAQRPQETEGWWVKEHGLEAARAKPAETARAEASYLRKILLENFESLRRKPPTEKAVAQLMEIYLSSIFHQYDNLRIALGERGVRLPAVAWDSAGSGPAAEGGASGAAGSAARTQRIAPGAKPGTTQKIGAPAESGPTMMPMVIVMSAVDYARCQTEGKGWEACATELAVRTGVGLGTAAVVTVVCAFSPLAEAVLPPVFVATFIVSSTLTLVDLVDEAGENISRADHQRRNEARLTAARIASIETMYRNRLNAAAVPPQYGQAIDREVAALATVVRRAREDLERFRTSNGLVKSASTACSDPARNPVGLAGEAERKVGSMKRLADAVDRRSTDARALLVPCAGVQSATGALAMLADATTDHETLAELSVEARRNIADAVEFFAILKAGRLADARAATELAALVNRIQEARRAQSAIVAAIAAYRAAAADHTRAHREVSLQFRALQMALPPSPAPLAAAMLDRLDQSLIRSYASALTGDRLTEIGLKAGDEVNRVEGLHRTAVRERIDLSKCTLADDLPVPLAQLLGSLGQDITTQVQRSDKAMRDAGSLRAQGQNCLKGGPQTTTRDTRFSGTFQLWVQYSVTQPDTQIGTLTLRHISKDRGERQAVAQIGTRALVDLPKCGRGAAGARATDPASEYYEGEIKWNLDSPFIIGLNRRPATTTPMADAVVVGCSSRHEPSRIDIVFSGTERRGGFFSLTRRGGFLKDTMYFDKSSATNTLFVRSP